MFQPVSASAGGMNSGLFLTAWRQGPGPSPGSFACRRVGRRLEPTAQVANGETGEPRDPGRAFVKAGNVVKFPASRLEERGLPLLRDFLECLQAVADKAGADDVDAPEALLRQRNQSRLRIRREPLCATETGLKRDHRLLSFQSQLGGDQPRRLLAMAVVRVAELECSSRHPVERKEQLVRPAIPDPILVAALYQCVDIAPIEI